MAHKQNLVCVAVVVCVVLPAMVLGLTSCASTTTRGAPTGSSAATNNAGGPGPTSLAIGVATTEGAGLVEQLGNAAISYLSGNGDLAGVQRLVAASAQESLAQMLSALDHPTSCKVLGFESHESSNEVGVELLFEGANQRAEFTVTILVDPDTRTVTALTAITAGPRVSRAAPTSTT